MKLIAAVVQSAPVLFDTPATLAHTERLMEQAAAAGAQLVVFPEAFIGGYPKGRTFTSSSARARPRAGASSRNTMTPPWP